MQPVPGLRQGKAAVQQEQEQRDGLALGLQFCANQLKAM